jgi:hypothetical protein
LKIKKVLTGIGAIAGWNLLSYPLARVSDPHQFELLDPDPDPHSNCGSGSRRAKMTHKNRKESRIFMFSSTGCSLLRAEGFSCSLGVLYGGQGISKLQF